MPLVLSDIRGRLAALRPSEETAAVAAALSHLEPRLERGLAEPLHFRRQLGELVRALQATWLLVEASADTESEKANVAAFFVRRRVSRDYDPEADTDYALLIDRLLGDDLLAPQSAGELRQPVPGGLRSVDSAEGAESMDALRTSDR